MSKYTKQFQVIVVALFLVLVSSLAAIANETNWQFLMRASSAANVSYGSNFTAGTKSSSTDAKDTSDVAGSYLSTGVANVMSLNPAYGGTPALYTSDYRATITGTQTKIWDLRVWRMQAMPGTDLKLVWWAATTAPVGNDPTGSFGGVDYMYTIEVYDDPTGQHQGYKWTSTDPTGGSSTAPLGSVTWTNLGSSEVKGDCYYPVDNGIKVRFTVAPVPEPSGILGLLSGISGLAGVFTLRKTSRK